MTQAAHPRQALLDPDEAAVPRIPVCDHYSGVEVRMRKSLALQAELGPVFDVTLDNEDGAPVGAEVEHAHLIAELLAGPENRFGRVGVRVLPFMHPRFADVLRVVLNAKRAPAYVMLPKPRHAADLAQAAEAVDAMGGKAIPLHTLIETHGALAEVEQIAAHPRIQSLSFGLMDFVSAHRGAVGAGAMSVAGQFTHPLIVRAKLNIAAACHLHGKVPSHSVITEFKDEAALAAATRRAIDEFGFTRQWSIHPSQVPVVVKAFAPSAQQVQEAVDILAAAQDAHWAPIQHKSTLHDRASYRYYWQLLERAALSSGAVGGSLPQAARQRWFNQAKA